LGRARPLIRRQAKSREKAENRATKGKGRDPRCKLSRGLTQQGMGERKSFYGVEIALRSGALSLQSSEFREWSSLKREGGGACEGVQRRPPRRGGRGLLALSPSLHLRCLPCHLGILFDFRSICPFTSAVFSESACLSPASSSSPSKLSHSLSFSLHPPLPLPFSHSLTHSPSLLHR